MDPRIPKEVRDLQTSVAFLATGYIAVILILGWVDYRLIRAEHALDCAIAQGVNCR